MLRSKARQTEWKPDGINEAINFDLKCIFVAIPKTGTTSIRNQTRPLNTKNYLANCPHLNILQIRDLIYPYLLINSVGKNRLFPSKNIKSDHDIREESSNIFNEFFKFSAVRNPWARLVSLYHRREGISCSSKMSFESFCENILYASDTCLHPTLHRNQYDWLCDENDLLAVDYVYKLEDFSAAIKIISQSTGGRVNLKEIKANRNPNSYSESYREAYNDTTKNVVARLFEKDIDFFKFSF